MASPAPAPISKPVDPWYRARWFLILKSWLARFLAAGAAFGVVFFRTRDLTDASIVASCVFLTGLFVL
jgi:hypothetical protein